MVTLLAVVLFGAIIWWIAATENDKHMWATQTAVAEAPTAAVVAENATAEPEPTEIVPTVTPTACLIKGNINSKGDKIYHVPGSSSYASTVIDTAAGERWFCTEEEAIAAGWHAPGK